MSSACANYHAKAGRQPLALVFMAMSFHNANIAALGLHIEGDDTDAVKLTAATLVDEKQYMHVAEKAGDQPGLTLLKTTLDETRNIAYQSTAQPHKLRAPQ
jgi:hypothetical protein